MGLFLPILLLAFAQPADLPAADASAQVSQAQSGSQSVAPRGFTLPRRKFDLADDNHAEAGRTARSPFGRTVRRSDPGEGPIVCLKMRSYYFERRDGLAPEFVGMTTCDPSSVRSLKKVDRPAHLEPAN
jgi:hypothetical protein